jgi:PAS domain S-box-containing protein
MLISIILIITVALQLTVAIMAFRLIRVSRGPVAWVLISIAFSLLAGQRIVELIDSFSLQAGNRMIDNINYLTGLFTSILITIGVSFIARILTSYKKTEDIRKVSEQRYRTLFNNTSDLIIVFDKKGNLIETNLAVSEALGYSKTELMTKNISDLTSSSHADILIDINIKLKGSDKYIFEAEYVSKNGTNIPVEINTKPLNLNREEYLICISRIITERREMRKKILKTIIDTEEKERKRFAKELHDGLGPLLSTIKLYINELEAENIESKEKKEYINYSNELIDEAVTNIRTISNNITPNIISGYGLVKSIESFCNKINKTQQIEVRFKTINIEGKFDETIELIFYRIVTELISNTIKHASASQINIVLEFLNNKLILTYKDDGVGFNLKEVLDDEKSGMGLKNIISRINSINGSYYFNENTGQGTEITIKVDADKPN